MKQYWIHRHFWHSFNQLGYSPSGLSDAIATATSWLEAAQNTDGGWGRAANDGASDSFVTGLTVVALREAGVASSEAYIQSARINLISESNPQPSPSPATRHWESSLSSVYHWFAHIPETTAYAVVAMLWTGSSNTDTGTQRGETDGKSSTDCNESLCLYSHGINTHQ